MLILHLIITSIAASFVGNIAYSRNIGYITDAFLHSTLFAAAISSIFGFSGVAANVIFAAFFSIILEVIRLKVKEGNAHFSNVTVAVSYSFVSLGLLLMPDGGSVVNEYAFGSLSVSPVDIIFSVFALLFAGFASYVTSQGRYVKMHSFVSNVAITITAALCIKVVGFFVSAIIIAIPPLSAHILTKKRSLCVAVAALISFVAMTLTFVIKANYPESSVAAIVGVINAVLLLTSIVFDIFFSKK